MKKINNNIASVLAEDVKVKAEKLRNSLDSKNVALVKQSNEFKIMQKIAKQRDALDKQYQILFDRLEHRFINVSISGYGSSISVKPSRSSYLNVRNIKSKIIIANHINGIPPEKVVDYVVNELVNTH